MSKRSYKISGLKSLGGAKISIMSARTKAKKETVLTRTRVGEIARRDR